MATIRMYVPSGSAGNAAGDGIIDSFTWNSGWTAAAPGSTVDYRYGYMDIPGIASMPPGWAEGGPPVTGEVEHTVSTGAFASSASRYGMRVAVGPLKAGATITGGATLTAGMEVRTSIFTNTIYVAFSAQIRDSNDNLQKTIEAAGTDWRDATINNTTLTTRYDQATAAATDYVIATGDYLIWEIGMFNDFLDSESRIFGLCSGQASDITSTDSTSTRNPFVEFTYTGTLAIDTGLVSKLMLLGAGT